MPRGTPTPVRSLRVPEDVWAAAEAKAAKQGTTVREVIVAALRRYVRR